jgi:heme exporter protein D
MSEFFHMGGYAFYVWGSFGVALVILVANVIIPVRHEHRLLREIAHKAAIRKRNPQ